MAIFNSNADDKHEGAKRGAPPAAGQVNMIAEGTVIEGSIKAQGDIRVGGRIKGELHADGRVMVAVEGVVEGQLVAANADVAGRVEGELRVSERLVLRSTARVDGQIKAGRLVVEEGALFGGTCEMGGLRAEVPAGTQAGAKAGTSALAPAAA